MSEDVVVTVLLEDDPVVTAVLDSPPIVTTALLTGPQGPQGPPGAPGTWEAMTQAEYDALDPKDPETLYVIIG